VEDTAKVINNLLNAISDDVFANFNRLICFENRIRRHSNGITVVIPTKIDMKSLLLVFCSR